MKVTDLVESYVMCTPKAQFAEAGSAVIHMGEQSVVETGSV